MSTPPSLDLPTATRRAAVETVRGTFAVLEALPEAHAADAAGLGTALLVPGYTGSKEDFNPVLGRLSAAGRHRHAAARDARAGRPVRGGGRGSRRDRPYRLPSRPVPHPDPGQGHPRGRCPA